MWDELDLGPTPTDESCIQAPYRTQEAQESALAECYRFINQIKRQFPPPPTVRISLKRNPYEHFSCYSVVVKFIALDKEAVEYAFDLEANLPTHWEDNTDATD